MRSSMLAIWRLSAVFFAPPAFASGGFHRAYGFTKTFGTSSTRNCASPTSDFKFEVHQILDSMEAFPWSAIAEPLAWPVVQFSSDSIAIALRDSRLAGSLRQVLPKQSVEVLVAASFLRVVGRCEVELHVGCFLDRFVVVELSPVVRRNRLELIRRTLD